MSLASAQRLLWAAEQGAPIQASQVRPHEFLNYFHFQTAEVAPSHTFSILASALSDVPGKLTFAFTVAGAQSEREPLDLTLILDRSGSMRDDRRMNYLKRGLHLMERSLRDGDRLDLVLFDNEACVPLENYVVGRDDPTLLTETIDLIKPRAGTNLGVGLQAGYKIATTHVEAGRNHRVLLVTDALVNEGQLDPDILAQVGKAFQENGVRLTGIGVGRKFSDLVLNKLTEAGRGPYLYLGSEAVVDRFFGSGFESMVRTLASNVRFSVDLPDSLAQERFYGEESSTDETEVQAIDYQSGTSQLFLEDLLVRDGKINQDDPVVFTIRWSNPVDGAEQEERLETTIGAMLSQSPQPIQKARTLMAWADMANAAAHDADACGQPYQTFLEHTKSVDDEEISDLAVLTGRVCGSMGAWSKTKFSPTTRVPAWDVPALNSAAQTLVVGGLESSLVAAVVKQHQSALQYCYLQELVKDPALAGKVSEKFVIGTDGTVVRAEVVASTLHSPKVEACINNRFLKMQFPKPKNNGIVIVKWPMQFSHG